MAEFRSITLQGEEIMCKDQTARDLAQKAMDKVDGFVSYAPSKGDSVAWIGDSWGAGNGTSDNMAYPERVSSRLGFNSKNYCVGGSGFLQKAGGTGKTFNDQLTDVILDNDTRDIKYLFIMGGFNDINHDYSGNELYSAAQALITRVGTSLPGVIIVWCGFNLKCKQVTRDFRDGYNYSIAAPLVSCDSPLIIVNNWQWALVGKSQYYNTDGVHPNDAGHLVIANAIVAALLGQNIKYCLTLSKPNTLWENTEITAGECEVIQENGNIIFKMPSVRLTNGMSGAYIKSTYQLPASARPATPQTAVCYTGDTEYQLLVMVNTDGYLYLQNKPMSNNVPSSTIFHTATITYPMYSA